jgi:hypothetical protein
MKVRRSAETFPPDQMVAAPLTRLPKMVVKKSGHRASAANPVCFLPFSSLSKARGSARQLGSTPEKRLHGSALAPVIGRDRKQNASPTNWKAPLPKLRFPSPLSRVSFGAAPLSLSGASFLLRYAFPLFDDPIFVIA